MLWLTSLLLIAILPDGRGVVQMSWFCGKNKHVKYDFKEDFESEKITFHAEYTEHNCRVTFHSMDGYKMFVDATRLRAICPLVTFYLDGVKVACTNMTGVAVATVVKTTAESVGPTVSGLESVTLTAFYEINNEECETSDEEECCQRQAQVFRDVALCDTNRCIEAELICDNVVHCEHGGDEAVWCRVWAWWVWVVGAVVALAVVAVVTLAVVVVVKKFRK